MKFIKVTTVSYYTLEMADKKHTVINGWTPEKVVKDWFTDGNINSRHASRDANKVGGGDRVVKTEILSATEFSKELMDNKAMPTPDDSPG